MKIAYKKEIYSKNTLLKSAYHFTDNFYVHLDADDNYYYVDITPKDGIEDNNIEKAFQNEMLAQTARESVLERTSDLRELILARAFASTIIEDTEIPAESAGDIKPDDYDYDTDVSDESIFEDWYKNHEG